ncbi:PC4 and SFRS1-interacting protein isoform X2 [Nilaparvata lugens]|uniref:PC4 and SFRS1-interacting protein isoform X2 n=1 Tax=Nilaparvata lugens TaxID=108931 RepID=UPI00193CCDE6|nr:PC4 and SFRS1-interacting protein isoform X2 [Nilaparvata lugens]
MAKRYGPGDKVFAKVRGYPPWPARVEGVADETPNKMKYHVFFYGTRETAICKTEELFSYIDNREKFGKPMKKRGFKEGIEQIEQELGLTPKARPANLNTSTASITPSENDSDIEGNLVIDEAPHGNSTQKKTPKAGLTTPSPKVSATKASKRKAAEVDKSAEPEAKKRQDTTPSSAEASHDSSIDESSVKSRSGRKIRPKKFADQEGAESTEGESTKASTDTSKEKKGQKDMICSVESSIDNVLTALTPGGQEVKIDLNKNKPESFKSDKARLQWHAESLKKALALKTKIESGEIIPEGIKKELEEIHHSRLKVIEEMGKGCSAEDNDFKLEYLRIEAQLLDIDVHIRGSLNLVRADPDNCLRLLDEMMEIQLTPLMLKKHPECVETIKKLRKYIGNTSRWNMDEEAVQNFTSKASMIRTKAEYVYNKLKSLFTVPDGKTFREAFAEEVKAFSKRTENLSVDEVFRLTKDPTPTAASPNKEATGKEE